MKNDFLKKYLVKGIIETLEKETQKRYIEGIKREGKNYTSNINTYIQTNASYLLEIAKKISYKKIQKNISFISQKKIENIYKNTETETEGNTTEYYLKDLKKANQKDIKPLLFEILQNSKKAYKRYNMLVDATEETEKDIYNHYVAKTNSIKKLDKTITLYNHDNNGAIEMFEDITQTAVCELIASKKYIFLQKDNKILITKKAYYSILQAIDKLIKRTEKQAKEPSLEELQDLKVLDYMLKKAYTETEETEETEGQKIVKQMFDNIEFTEKQKNIINLIQKTSLSDKDIYNNLGISKQAFYKHLQNIKKQVINYITEHKINVKYV